MIGFDHVDDRLDDRRRREELAVVVGLLNRELGEEVLVDAAEDVTRGLSNLLTVEEAHEVFQHARLEDTEVFRQDPLQGLELLLDCGHCTGDKLGEVAAASGASVMIQS